MYFVYILRGNDSSLYTGYTNNLCRRFYEHNYTDKGAKYTRLKRPLKLEYFELYESKSQAMKREYEIKKFKKNEKENLLVKKSF